MKAFFLLPPVFAVFVLSAFAANAAKPAGGVFTLLAVNQPPDNIPELFDPDVAGISARFHWSVIEPRAGQYRWDKIDAALATAQKHGKKAMIRIIAGIYTPEWVYQGGTPATEAAFDQRDLQKWRRTAQWTPQRERLLTGASKLPVVWDENYLKHWLAFVKKFGERYDGHPALYSVQMTGGGLAGEMNLREEFHLERWGYSDEKMIGVWTRIIAAYQESFPRTPTNLDLLEPLRGKSHVVRPVVDFCLKNYPQKVYLQNNGLNEKGGAPAIRELLRQASASTVIGYQMTGGRNWNDSLTGDRGKAFKAALDDGARYVEVYHADFLDPALAPAIKNLAKKLAGE
ncbi:MAG: beta-galactosidase [Alphaproteobacteria bacterium]|nr:beta-galactosidase [Alphaproteobacteria bacterium]